MDSLGLIRVIPATPRPVAVDNATESDAIEIVDGTSFAKCYMALYSKMFLKIQANTF